MFVIFSPNPALPRPRPFSLAIAVRWNSGSLPLSMMSIAGRRIIAIGDAGNAGRLLRTASQDTTAVLLQQITEAVDAQVRVLPPSAGKRDRNLDRHGVIRPVSRDGKEFPSHGFVNLLQAYVASKKLHARIKRNLSKHVNAELSCFDAILSYYESNRLIRPGTKPHWI